MWENSLKMSIVKKLMGLEGLSERHDCKHFTRELSFVVLKKNISTKNIIKGRTNMKKEL